MHDLQCHNIDQILSEIWLLVSLIYKSFSRTDFGHAVDRVSKQAGNASCRVGSFTENQSGS